MMFNPFSALTSKIYGAIAIAAITFACVQTVRIDGLWFIDGYVDKLADARETIREMEAASKIATAAQIELNKQIADKQTQIAKDADNDQTTRRDIADRSNDYANRMRADGYCRKASATAEDSLAGIDTSASDTSIVVSEADFRVLTDNTARLMDVRAWGQKLIDEGLAAPVDGQTAPDTP